MKKVQFAPEPKKKAETKPTPPKEAPIPTQKVVETGFSGVIREEPADSKGNVDATQSSGEKKVSRFKQSMMKN